MGLDQVAIVVFLPLFIPSTFKDFSGTEYTALPHILLHTYTLHIKRCRREQTCSDETRK